MNPFRRQLLLPCFLLLALITGCAGKDPLFTPTGKAAFVPDKGTPFPEYVQESRENIRQILDTVRPENGKRKYLGGYTNAQAAAMEKTATCR